jgi:hypothetical protein
MRILILCLLVTLGKNTAHADQLFDTLNRLPKVSAAEITTPEDRLTGMRRFSLLIDQPVDHFDSSSGTFKQKLILFHRSFNEPMVLQNSGYAIYDESLTDVAKLFETNQIQIENRYFLNSTPSPLDWSKLTIRQSAEDFHRVVETFKTLYSKRWVGTGRSKGGITSVIHRYYYPNDLDGTLALVAPLMTSTKDEAFSHFLKKVGGEPYASCRQALRDLQVLLLQKKSEVMPLVPGSYLAIGSKEMAYEHAVILLPQIFWMSNPDEPKFGCAQVPGASASTAQLFEYMQAVSSPELFSDFWFLYYRAFHYQCALELGFPAYDISHISNLLRFPYNLDLYLEEPVVFNPLPMQDIAKWVKTESTQMVFIYGEFDFWSGRKFEPNLAPGTDNHVFVVPRGGHRTSHLNTLTPEQQKDALDALARWFNKAPRVTTLGQHF